jgi:hypothetical protein
MPRFEIRLSSTPYRAMWLRIGQSRAYPIVPVRSLLALATIVLGLALVAILVEGQLTSKAAEGLVNVPTWVDHNRVLTKENYAKVQNSLESPVMRTIGYTPPDPVPDRRRILVIGDSYIWGDGHSNLNLTWWRQLQWELERRGYREVDVIAAGTNGASTQDQYRWLAEGDLLGQTKPDVVVFGYVTNDPQIRDENGVDLVKVRRPVPAGDPQRATPLGAAFPNLEFAVSTRINEKRERSDGDEASFPYGIWMKKILEGRNFEEYRKVLAGLKVVIDDAAIPVFFVTTPHVPKADSYEPLYAPVKLAFEEAGIEFLDLLPALIARADSGNVRGTLHWGANPANGHPGPFLTHSFASLVADILEERHPDTLGTRSSAPVPFAPAINDWIPATLAPRKTGENQWTFRYDGDTARMLRMPVDRAHVTLSFERPVSIRSIRLSGENDDRFQVWATVLDDEQSYETRDYVPLADAAPSSEAIVVPPAVSGRRVTSLRIAVDGGGRTMKTIAELDANKIEGSTGKSFIYRIPALAEEADTNERPSASPYVLLEDGQPLALPHSLHAEIRSTGMGRYSHWTDYILFSSSDGSDPRNSGRRYTVVLFEDRLIRLEIEFNDPAVSL